MWVRIRYPKISWSPLENRSFPGDLWRCWFSWEPLKFQCVGTYQWYQEGTLGNSNESYKSIARGYNSPSSNKQVKRIGLHPVFLECLLFRVNLAHLQPLRLEILAVGFPSPQKIEHSQQPQTNDESKKTTSKPTKHNKESKENRINKSKLNKDNRGQQRTTRTPSKTQNRQTRQNTQQT